MPEPNLEYLEPRGPGLRWTKLVCGQTPLPLFGNFHFFINMEWDSLKENAGPLARGRNAATLSNALKSQAQGKGDVMVDNMPYPQVIVIQLFFNTNILTSFPCHSRSISTN